MILIEGGLKMQQKSVSYDMNKDPQFQKPYIDIDEWRNGVHYIHGGFENTNTRFSFYFPKKEDYEGRFFHFMSPIPGSENASEGAEEEEDKIGFAISHGAYFVESNMGNDPSDSTIIYRSSAAVAEYSRLVATKLYGDHHPYGYIYGGSGGGYKTISCFENTENIWDGAVPFVIGSPMAMPNVFTVRAHALRILRNKLPMIVDALEPGGSGDIYAGLNSDEKEALEEATKMGFPLRAWFSTHFIGDGALPVLAPIIERADSTYFEDFWTLPGYLGADPNSSAVKDRLQFETDIIELFIPGKVEESEISNDTGVDEAWKTFQRLDGATSQPWVKLESVPSEDSYLKGVNIHFLTGEAAGFKIPLEKLVGNKAFIGAGYGLDGMIEMLAKAKPGDKIILDNSNYIAIQTYHRHQVPREGYSIYDQFRDKNGVPLYPQRPTLMGPSISRGGAGSIQTGCFNGKMIVVASLLDESAFPWHADWYRKRVKEVLEDKELQFFRLWFIDNAMHDDSAQVAGDTHVVSYLGALHQALLDLSDWVERGIEPAQSTTYSVFDGQISVPSGAKERKGIQPVVELKVNHTKSTEVSVGEQVQFTAYVEMPDNAGILTTVDWNFEGESGQFENGEYESVQKDGTIGTVKSSHIFSHPGTYYPVIRVKSNRHGKRDDIYTQVQNLSRVRVVVN